MKYSLRSLMIGLTLFCVLLGGRIEYLRRMAVFHEQEASRHALEWEKVAGWNPAHPPLADFELLGVSLEHLEQFDAHQRLARYYRTATYRPWQVSPPSADNQPSAPAPNP